MDVVSTEGNGKVSTTRERWARVIAAGRKKRGMTQTQLAAQMSLSHATIRAIEAGNRAPSPEVLERLVRYLHIHPVDLFYDEELMT